MLNFRKCALALASVAALAVPGIAAAEGMVGISMPTKTSARWIADGDNMVKQFQEAGYQTDLQYADDDIPKQLAQIENMITKGVNVLVIAAIDGTTLSNALENAAAGPDYDALRDAAHSLKSSSANLGAMQLSAAAKRVELGARTGSLDRPAVEVARIAWEFSRAREILLDALPRAEA